MLKPNPLNTSSDTYKVTRATPDLLQAACNLVNDYSLSNVDKLKQSLIKAGCVTTDSDSGGVDE